MKKLFFMIMILMVSVVVFGQEKNSAAGLGFMFMTPTDNIFSNKSFGGSLSIEGLVDKVYVNTSLNVLKNYNLWSGIWDLAIGYTTFGNPFWIGIYGGLGLGITFADDWFAWKVNGGILTGLHYLFLKFDVSYGTILGPTFGVGFGFLARSINE